MEKSRLATSAGSLWLPDLFRASRTRKPIYAGLSMALAPDLASKQDLGFYILLGGSGQRIGVAPRFQPPPPPTATLSFGSAGKGAYMPELPEVEALRHSLDESISASEIATAGPAHVATLKTVAPPLEALVKRRFSSVARRGKRLLFPTTDGELVLVVHLMSAGRLRALRSGERAPLRPAFRLRFADGRELVLTEPGKRKRAGVWLFGSDEVEAELADLGPDALGLDRELVERLLTGKRRRLHGLLRDQRVTSGIGRAWANEILHAARLSPFALASDLSGEELDRLTRAIRTELERGIEARERGLADEHVYRIHGKLDQPCSVCGAPIARVVYEEHTVYYCPRCQTRGRLLADRRLSRILR